ncbi:immunity protein Imm33 domain-containing protein [Thioclava sp. FR2]|uniref:immunity protein Imm33 domain-containing protein n=1 Tax=Thioclava sp. FR2 TaxID=3445780 RepID=UPI003EBDA4A5
MLSGAEPVEYIYRDVPMDSEGDEHPDSGWCIRGRASGTQEEYDARTASYVALGKVLNIDDSWLAFIDAPVGTRLVRDFETGEWSASDSLPEDS